MASVKAKRMTTPQFRKASKNLSTQDLITLLEGMYKSCPDAADYLNLRLAGDGFKAAFNTETQDLLHNCFYTKKGKARLNLPEAKAIIDRFERICPDAESILDLKLRYVEYGMKIINNYTHIPDTLYRGVERMFQSIAKDIGSLENIDAARILREKFESRLEEAGKEFGYGEPGFHKCMHEVYLGIHWSDGQSRAEINADAMEQIQSSALSDSSGKCTPPDLTEPAPITYSGNILSQEDSDLFFELLYPLLNYANEKLQINDLTDIKRNEPVDLSALKEIQNAIWNNPSVIDDYLNDTGSILSSEHQAIVRGFKRAVNRQFILERYLKNGSILISMDDDRVYQVRALTTKFEDMIPDYRLPIIISTALLPFRGIIISDGLFNLSNIIMGSTMKKELKNIYSLAKRRNQIITSL